MIMVHEVTFNNGDVRYYENMDQGGLADKYAEANNLIIIDVDVVELENWNNVE